MTPRPLPDWIVALRGWMRRQRKISLIAGSVALLLFCWGVYVPQLMAIRRMGTRWSGLKSEMAETRLLTNLARDGRLRLLPGPEELPELLEQLHVQARECRVNLQEILPGRPDFSDPSKPAFLRVQMRMEGEYRAIGEFLGRLRGEPLFGVVTVRSLRVGREEALLPRLRVQLSIEIALKAGAAREG